MNQGNLIRLFLIFILSASCLHADAQTNWRKEYNKQGGKLQRAEWLYQTLKLRKQYVEHEAEMLEESLKLAEELMIDSVTAKTHSAVGKYYHRIGEMQAAWDEFQVAKKIYLKNRLFNYVGGVLYNQSIILLNQSFGDSLIRYLESYKGLHKFMTDEQIKLYLRSMKAAAYQTAGRKQNALEEYELILPLASQLNDTSLMLATIINLGMLQNTFDSTMMWYRKGLPIAKVSLPDKYAKLLLKTGFAYNSRDDIRKDSALYYFLEAEKMSGAFLSPILHIQTQSCISDFFMSKEEYQLALPHLRKAVALSANIPGKNANLAVHNLGICFIHLNQGDSAAYYLGKYKAGIEQYGDDYQWMLYHHAMARFSQLNGDTCSLQAQRNRNQALFYASRINETRISLSTIYDASDCILRQKQPAGTLPLVKELLGYFKHYQPLIRKNETLYAYSTFLSYYAKIESLYGNKDKALDLYDQLTLVMSRIETEKYKAGHNEALIKYKTELKDQEIAYGKRKNIALTIGALLLCGIVLIIFFALYKTNRLNKQISAQKTELLQLNHVKDRLFSVISHDMRAPVSSLLSFIQLLDKGAIPAEKFPAFIQELKTKLGYTAGLMDNLLNWAHSQMQGYKPSMKEFDLSEITSEVISLLKGEAEKKHIAIENGITDQYMVYADINMTSLLMRNLLGNAIKFTHPHEKIIISGFEKKNAKGFIIQDFGVGISHELVEAFNNTPAEGPLESTLGTANEKGTGLGLMLCKSFAKLMGGSINLESEPGKGSCFRVYFAS